MASNDVPTCPAISGRTDRDPISYRAGEEIAFELRATGASRIRWTRTGDDGATASGEEPAGAPVAVRTALDRPGFVRLVADALDGSGAAVAHFEGGAGADVDAIRADTPEPPDFDAFWARRLAALAAVPAGGAECRERPSGRADVRLFEVAVPCAGGRPSTGLLTVPAAGGRHPAFARFRGYEASWSRIAWSPPPPEEMRADALVLHLSAHGYAFGREPAYYAALRAASGSRGHDVAFDPVQNADPDTAYFGGIVWRVLRGLEFLKRRPEWDGRSLTVFGGSLGGLQAIWAAALDADVTECRPRIPWCCNMAGPAAGRAHGDWFVPWVPALAYYDPVNMARRIRATCRVAIPQAGLGDYISPPSGVMAFHNALRCPKSVTFIQGAMHFTLPPEPWQTGGRQA